MKPRVAQSATVAGSLVACALMGGPASGAGSAAADKFAFGVLDPTPDDALRAFAPDRPARAISPVTVDAGRFQIESDVLNTTFSNQQGASTRTFQPPTRC